MPVRAEHCRSSSINVLGPVETSGHVVAAQALEIDFLDCVGAVISQAEDVSAEVGFGWLRPEAGADQNLMTELICASQPFVL